MKFILSAAAALFLAATASASAQVNAYVEMSASKLTNLATTNYLYGPTVGVNGRIASVKRLQVSVDIRGQFLGSGQRLDSVALGPLVSFKVKRFEPYAEFMVGFARYNDGAHNATTDSSIDLNGGIERGIKGRFAWRIFEFGYKQYYGLGGQFNPKTFSTGVVYSLGGR